MVLATSHNSVRPTRTTILRQKAIKLKQQQQQLTQTIVTKLCISNPKTRKRKQAPAQTQPLAQTQPSAASPVATPNFNQPPNLNDNVKQSFPSTETTSLLQEEERHKLQDNLHSSSVRVWSVGQNMSHQLGLPHTFDSPKFQPVRKNDSGNPFFRCRQPSSPFHKTIATGAMTTYLIDHDGRVWGCGSNDDGELGRTGGDDIEGLVRVVREKCMGVVAGGCFGACLSETRRVYVWGTWRDETSGKKWPVSTSGKPVLMNIPRKGLKTRGKVVKISAGTSHLVVLTSDGDVFGVGVNDQRQLKDDDSLLYPRLTFLSGNAKNVWATGNTTWILTKQDRLFAWGSNSHGQLGVGVRTAIRQNQASCSKKPVRLQQVQDIIGGIDFTLVLTKDGSIYSCGRGDFGQLGTVEACRHSNVFICPRFKPVTTYITASDLSTTLTSNPPPFEDDVSFRLIQDRCLSLRHQKLPPIVSVSACSRSVYAVDGDGNLYVWGDNYSGQLATHSISSSAPVQGLPLPTRLSFKTNPTIVQCSLGWGHGFIAVHE